MLDLTYLPNLGCIFNISLCSFDSSLTLAGALVAIVAVMGVAVSYKLMQKRVKDPFKHLLLLAIGILLFETFTAPMWNSANLGFYSYIYNDMSLILTLGWVAVFQLSILFIDWLFPKLGQVWRFLLYLIPITLITIIAETALVITDIRSYAPEIWQTSIGNLGLLPIESLYYAPAFATLVLSFYFAWTRTSGDPLRNAFKHNIGLTAVILTVGIFIYELLIEPVVHTPGFPVWSYFYQDISFIRIGIWVMMIFLGMWAGSLLLGKAKKISQHKVFWTYVLASSVAFYIIETILLANKGRIYTNSVVTNFTGLQLPLLNTPIEVVIAIVIYLALVISFLKYWRFVLVKN